MRNVGTEPVPFGVGAHPYLRAGDAPIDDCVLTVAAATTIPLDGGLPTGPATAVPAELDLRAGRPVKELDLDNAFGGAAPAEGDTHVRHHLAAPDGTTELWADPVFGYVQVFTPPDLVGRGRAVAVEPMTCPPDALNTGDGLITARPGRDLVGELGHSATGGREMKDLQRGRRAARRGGHPRRRERLDDGRPVAGRHVRRRHRRPPVDPRRPGAGQGRARSAAPIAHGFLTLSLLSRPARAGLPRSTASRWAINYGLNKVRFTAPVPVGSKVRGVVDIADVDGREGRGRAGDARGSPSRSRGRSGPRWSRSGSLVSMRDAVICEPLRTPVGGFGGALRDVPAHELAATVVRALIARTGLDPAAVDDVLLGHCYPTMEAPAIGRVVALDAGLPVTATGLQIDRRCGSGLQAVLYAAMQVQTGGVGGRARGRRRVDVERAVLLDGDALGRARRPRRRCCTTRWPAAGSRRAARTTRCPAG